MAGEETVSFVKEIVAAGKTILSDLDDRGTNSLAAYTKASTIKSRVFIENTLINENVTNDILGTVHSLYVSWIISALQMSTFVSKTQTVRDILKTVATENVATDADPFHQDVFVAIEALGAEAPKEPRKPGPVTVTGNHGRDRTEAASPVPAGRLVTITLSHPDQAGKTIDLSVLVELAPYMIPGEVAEQFLTMNITPSFRQRFLQWKAGEISFWSDLVGQADLARERRKMLKTSDSAELLEVIEEQNRALRKTGSNFMSEPNARRRNAANAVFIIEKSTLDRIANPAVTGFDFNKASDRKRFFDQSFAMIVAVVDTMYSQVTIYINGVNKAGTYTYRQLEKTASSSSGDIMQVLQAINQGSMPRF